MNNLESKNLIKRTMLLLSIGIVIVIAIKFFNLYSEPKQSITSVELGEKAFTVEVPATETLKQKGLSGHAPLGESEGMLFVFDTPSTYGFWMKDMTFPLDIIWIGADYKITHIERSLATSTYPTIYYPEVDSKYVLEISAGESDLLHIQKGDTVVINSKM